MPPDGVARADGAAGFEQLERGGLVGHQDHNPLTDNRDRLVGATGRRSEDGHPVAGTQTRRLPIVDHDELAGASHGPSVGAEQHLSRLIEVWLPRRLWSDVGRPLERCQQIAPA